MTSTPAPKRRKLDQATVVAEAIALADAEGMDALSMRALAARLEVVPMALYKHVADKEDLIGRMVDQVIEGYGDPGRASEGVAGNARVGAREGASESARQGASQDTGPSWRTRVRTRVLDARESILMHPWLAPAIDTRKRRTEAILAHMNAVAGEFIAGGLSPDLTHYAMHALGNRIWGYSTEAFEDADAPTPEDADQPALLEYMTENFPHVVAIGMDAARRNPSGGCEQQTEFEFTLDLLLDSIERLHDANWESRAIPED